MALGYEFGASVHCHSAVFAGLWGIGNNSTVAGVYGVLTVGTQVGLVGVISVGLGIIII